MLKFLIICAALFFFANESDGFQCYNGTDENFEVKDCAEGIEYCVKKQKTENDTIIRDCGEYTGKKTEMECFNGYGIGDYFLRCNCNTTLCNSARLVKASQQQLFILVLIFACNL